MFTSVSNSGMARIGGGCLALLAGCTVGPKYVRPSVAVPPAYKEARRAGRPVRSGNHPSRGDQTSRGDWWTGFNDPRLNELEQSSTSRTRILRPPRRRSRGSRAHVGKSRSQYFPDRHGGRRHHQSTSVDIRPATGGRHLFGTFHCRCRRPGNRIFGAVSGTQSKPTRTRLRPAWPISKTCVSPRRRSWRSTTSSFVRRTN